jgi:glutamine amidotransferase
MIVIIDYGMGNLLSVLKAFRRIDVQAKISSSPEDIKQAKKLILPGVGHFKRGMENLRELRLIDVLNKKVLEEGTPILGICLGMQLFTKHSEEGDAEGLGWFNANTVRFQLERDARNLRVPHMGWNNIQSSTGNNQLFKGIESSATFYFVHSYHVVCDKAEDVMATTEYGIRFMSAIGRDNISGVQFHPEKSHDTGMKILKNFAEQSYVKANLLVS